MTRLYQFGALALAIAAIGALAQPVQVAEVRTDDGNVLVCHRTAPGGIVTLVFTHSMYGGEVRETWRVDGDGLDRVQIVTENAAAAEYYATDGRTRRVDGGVEVLALPAHVDTLPFRIDHIGNHRLRLDDEEISLASEVEESAGATLSAVQVPLLARLFNVEAGCGR